jgi:hypothetical protein
MSQARRCGRLVADNGGGLGGGRGAAGPLMGVGGVGVVRRRGETSESDVGDGDIWQRGLV